MSKNYSGWAVLGSVVVACSLVMTLGAPSSARIVDRGTFHEEFSDTDDDFCGAGLSVEFDGTVDGRFRVVERGPGSFGYYLENVRVRVVFTDLATDQTATDIQPNTLGKDQRIIDNGDGTLTVFTLLTGGARTYGDDGRLIAKNSGQVRFKLIVDAETFDLISEELIFGSTGTNDDFCEAVLTDWGYSS
jgi:hypothetical protein